ARPFGDQALAQNYAYASFCLRVAKQDRVTRPEFAETLDSIAVPGILGRAFRTPYIVDLSDEAPRLTMMVADCGNKPDRIAAKTRRFIQRRLEASQDFVRDFIRPNRFNVVVICGFEQKAQRIRELVASNRTPTSVVVAPGYGELLIALG